MILAVTNAVLCGRVGLNTTRVVKMAKATGVTIIR